MASIFDSMDLDSVKAKIKDLFATGIEFDRALARLQNVRGIAGSDAVVRARVDGILFRGEQIKRTISNAVQSLQGVYGWVKENLGINLGFLPLIPIAVIGGVLSALATAKAWITEANAEARRLEIIAALPQEQRAKALASATGTTWHGNLAQTAMWIGLAVIAVVVIPKLLEKR